MPSKNPVQRLILENIETIQAFVAGMNFDEFMHDRKTAYAVTRALEIISEGSRRLPEEMKQAHPEIDWTAVAAAGNVYRLEYEAVDEAQLWQTAQRGLAALTAVVRDELDRLHQS